MTVAEFKFKLENRDHLTDKIRQACCCEANFNEAVQEIQRRLRFASTTPQDPTAVVEEFLSDILSGKWKFKI
jgi:hypothetical protein